MEQVGDVIIGSLIVIGVAVVLVLAGKFIGWLLGPRSSDRSESSGSQPAGENDDQQQAINDRYDQREQRREMQEERREQQRERQSRLDAAEEDRSEREWGQKMRSWGYTQKEVDEERKNRQKGR